MKRKFYRGIIAALVGLGLIGFSYNAMMRISNAKKGVALINQPLSRSPFGDTAASALTKKASQYDTLVIVCFYTGLVLLVGGGYYAFRHRR